MYGSHSVRDRLTGITTLLLSSTHLAYPYLASILQDLDTKKRPHSRAAVLVFDES